MVFIVTGRIPSKKNELVGVVDRNDAFEYLKPLPDVITKKQAITALFKTFARIKNSLVYEKWENETVELFKQQQLVFRDAAIRNGLTFPLSNVTIAIKFYWKGKYRRDNSNKSEGIHDALVKAHIIMDDSDRVMPDTEQRARDYSDEILKSMAVIYITAEINKKPTD